MSSLVSRLKSELANRQLAVEAAYKEINRQEKIAKRDKTTIPPFQMEQMMNEVRFCRNQVQAVEASLAGASKYPPLSFSRED